LIGRNDQLKYGSAYPDGCGSELIEARLDMKANRSLNICFPSMMKSLTA
jgi:hypothetical protein